VWEREPGDKRLAAYMVVKPGHHFQPNELRFLKERLPEMILQFHKSRRALIEWQGQSHGMHTGQGEARPRARTSQARNDTEQKLVQIWEDLPVNRSA
jgi:hypothetical protein